MCQYTGMYLRGFCRSIMKKGKWVWLYLRDIGKTKQRWLFQHVHICYKLQCGSKVNPKFGSFNFFFQNPTRHQSCTQKFTKTVESPSKTWAHLLTTLPLRNNFFGKYSPDRSQCSENSGLWTQSLGRKVS